MIICYATACEYNGFDIDIDRNICTKDGTTITDDLICEDYSQKVSITHT